MNPFAAILLGLVPIITLTALLIGLPYLEAKCRGGRSRHRRMEDARPAPDPAGANADRSGAPAALDLQLTTVLADSGQVLVGYKTSHHSADGYRSSTNVSPTATGTLLLAVGQNDEAIESTLDRWSKEGIELALRTSDDSDVVVLCDRRTAQQLVLSQIRAP
jgi:hypothetical protein